MSFEIINFKKTETTSYEYRKEPEICALALNEC